MYIYTYINWGGEAHRKQWQIRWITWRMSGPETDCTQQIWTWWFGKASVNTVGDFWGNLMKCCCSYHPCAIKKICVSILGGGVVSFQIQLVSGQGKDYWGHQSVVEISSEFGFTSLQRISKSPQKNGGWLTLIWTSNHLGVSINRGTQKWMIYNGKPYQNEWFGGAIIFGNTHLEYDDSILGISFVVPF